MVSLKEMARLDAERAPPAWLAALLEATFFEPCPEHPLTSSSRVTRTSASGCNFFCTDCAGGALCSGACAAAHSGHRLIQVRRSSGHNVVRVSELEPLLSVSLVQTYQINNEAVVFLNRRPMAGQGKAGASRCEECERGLHNADCRFCSLGCKSEAVLGKDDFSVSFAVDWDIESGDEPESGDDDDSPRRRRPTKLRKLATASASGKKVAGKTAAKP